MNKKLTEITVIQFADSLGVSHDTVVRWLKKGKVRGGKKGPFPGKTSPFLIPASELERVQKLMQNDRTDGLQKTS